MFSLLFGGGSSAAAPVDKDPSTPSYVCSPDVFPPPEGLRAPELGIVQPRTLSPTSGGLLRTRSSSPNSVISGPGGFVGSAKLPPRPVSTGGSLSPVDRGGSLAEPTRTSTEAEHQLPQTSSPAQQDEHAAPTGPVGTEEGVLLHQHLQQRSVVPQHPEQRPKQIQRPLLPRSEDDIPTSPTRSAQLSSPTRSAVRRAQQRRANTPVYRRVAQAPDGRILRGFETLEVRSAESSGASKLWKLRNSGTEFCASPRSAGVLPQDTRRPPASRSHGMVRVSCEQAGPWTGVLLRARAGRSVSPTVYMWLVGHVSVWDNGTRPKKKTFGEVHVWGGRGAVRGYQRVATTGRSCQRVATRVEWDNESHSHGGVPTAGAIPTT